MTWRRLSDHSDWIRVRWTRHLSWSVPHSFGEEFAEAPSANKHDDGQDDLGRRKDADVDKDKDPKENSTCKSFVLLASASGRTDLRPFTMSFVFPK